MFEMIIKWHRKIRCWSGSHDRILVSGFYPSGKCEYCGEIGVFNPDNPSKVVFSRG